jgi:hypothetical protein
VYAPTCCVTTDVAHVVGLKSAGRSQAVRLECRSCISVPMCCTKVRGLRVWLETSTNTALLNVDRGILRAHVTDSDWSIVGNCWLHTGNTDRCRLLLVKRHLPSVGCELCHYVMHFVRPFFCRLRMLHAPGRNVCSACAEQTWCQHCTPTSPFWQVTPRPNNTRHMPHLLLKGRIWECAAFRGGPLS